MAGTVNWTPGALNRLSDLWVAASDRNAVTRAVHRVDQTLAANPTAGHHLSEGLYRFRIPPVTVFYEIDSVKNIVNVTAVDVS
jgi:mRNA-degrading endonuclease RelE of RelBE toxin-antitoxin system